MLLFFPFWKGKSIESDAVLVTEFSMATFLDFFF